MGVYLDDLWDWWSDKEVSGGSSHTLGKQCPSKALKVVCTKWVEKRLHTVVANAHQGCIRLLWNINREDQGKKNTPLTTPKPKKTHTFLIWHLSHPKINTRIPSRAVLLGGELNRDFCNGYIYIYNYPFNQRDFFFYCSLLFLEILWSQDTQNCWSKNHSIMWATKKNSYFPIILVV